MTSDLPYLFSLPTKERRDLFDAGSTKMGWPAYIVEKDYHVTLVLKLLFQDLKPKCQQNTGHPFLFKGGTTLSKVYGCIDRMSEDIDLSLSMDYLGHPEPDEESNTQRGKRIKRLDIAAKREVRETLAPFLQRQLSALDEGYSVSVLENGLDIDVRYPRSLGRGGYSSGYVRPRVLVECGGKAGFDPHESHGIEPLAMAAADISGDSCTVDVLGSDRTFFEKLTLIHELNHRGVACLGERQSRHLYDLVKIHEAFPSHVDNKDLWESVRVHKNRYFKRGAARWEEAIPGTLYLMPKDGVAQQLRHDWQKMADMFPSGLPLTFDDLLLRIQKIDAIVNQR